METTKLTITSIAGNAIGFAHENNLLIVDLDRSYSKGDHISVTMYYHGHPSSGSNFQLKNFYLSNKNKIVYSYKKMGHHKIVRSSCTA